MRFVRMQESSRRRGETAPRAPRPQSPYGRGGWLRLGLGLLCLSLGLGAPGLAAAASPASVDLGAREGVQEIVVSVKNLEAASAVYQSVGGWEVKHAGAAPPGLAAAWGLPPATPIREVVLGVPGIDRGLLRLVRIDGLPQVQIRSSARPFDTGGLFNFNVLVKDIDSVFEALRDRGFFGYADPNRYALFGRRYAGALLHGHDGVVINLLQRVDQPYDDLPPFTGMSPVINATQMVADYERAFRFFTETLGWEVRWEASPTWEASGANNMGLPDSLVREGKIGERAASFRPSPTADGGTIEIFAFTGIAGKDYAARAVAPNWGLLAYRIHVPGLERYLSALATRGAVPIKPLERLEIPPYGMVLHTILRAPDGAWLELIEQSDSAAPSLP
jgi:catechol 2,3-dioxygenase-like lactoylglutathione lyase family enzyme